MIDDLLFRIGVNACGRANQMRDGRALSMMGRWFIEMAKPLPAPKPDPVLFRKAERRRVKLTGTITADHRGASPVPFDGFDWKAPDYHSVTVRRIHTLLWVRADPAKRLPPLWAYYRTHPWDFINDWGMTYDPRNVGLAGMKSTMPFVLFDKQVDWLKWAYERWVLRQEGVTEKSRDVGISWLAVAFACTLCIFYPEMAIGFGSRKEEYVDKAGFPRALFFKARLFMDNLPAEFQMGWSRRGDAHMRMSFPGNKSIITGESGDNIGRGDRTGLYITDEDAQIEHPDLVDAALSATTNCRIRVSSANGTANSFYLKRQQYAGTAQLFTLHWRDNPLWSQARYDAKAAEVNNPVIMAQEYDINYAASIEGVLIPSTWVQAAVDAHVKLGFGYDGDKWASLDLADAGRDKNAMCGAHGVVVEHLDQWGGEPGDFTPTARLAFSDCDALGYKRLRYDADGIGATFKGVCKTININERKGTHSIETQPWRGSGEIVEPKKLIPGTDRTNLDFFANAKAQGYWALRDRFRKTYLAVTSLGTSKPVTFPSDQLISLASDTIAPGALAQATTELSQPTAEPNGAGKLVVDKTPDDAPSPNYADAIMMRFAPAKRSSGLVSKEVLGMMRAQGRRRFG